VTLNLIPGLQVLGYKPFIVLSQMKGSLLAQVPSDVEIISLNCRRTLATFWPLVQLLRTRRPAVLVSSLGHNNIIAILARSVAKVETRVVICQHACLSAECKWNGRWRYAVLPLLLRAFGSSADGIVAVSEGVADDMAALANLPRRR